MRELVDGLLSEYPERFNAALNSAPGLIRADLADLDLYISRLLDIFVGVSNKFSIGGFAEL